MSRPVVLIHGMWCTGAHLARVAKGLRSRGFRCFTPTLPGRPGVAAPASVATLGIADYVTYLKDYIAEQGFAQAPVLVGHAMGGLLAQKLAAELDIFALVLLTPAAPSGVQALGVDPAIALGRAFLTPGFWKKAQKPNFARASGRAFNSVPARRHGPLYEGLVEESGRVVYEIALWWADAGRATRVDAGQVRCPVYVVSAGQDRLTPARVVRKVAARYPGASLRHYPSRGHWVIDDQDTEDMVGEIAAWLLPFEQRAAHGIPLR